MTDAVIEAVGLTKRFGKVEALAGLDLVAEAGPGRPPCSAPTAPARRPSSARSPRWSGPTAGTLTVAGIDAARGTRRQVRQMIGLAGQYAAVEAAMTGRENLEMVGRLFGHDRRTAARNAGVVLEQIDLVDAGDRLVRTYSGGMRRRLDLGASLVGAPRVLLLDEPTTGLDPRSRNQLWEAIRQLVAAGTDVLLTTQYLDEADQLAHQVAIIDKGRVIAHGTPGELKAQAGRDMIEVHARDRADLDRLAAVLAPLGAEEPRIDANTSRVTIPVDGGRAAIARAVRLLDDVDVAIDDIGLRRPTLDEVFLALTGEPIADPEAGPEGDGDAQADADPAGRGTTAAPDHADSVLQEQP